MIRGAAEPVLELSWNFSGNTGNAISARLLHSIAGLLPDRLRVLAADRRAGHDILAGQEVVAALPVERHREAHRSLLKAARFDRDQHRVLGPLGSRWAGGA